MDDLKIYKKIDINTPGMVAGWPGMGNVALGVVDYLRGALKASGIPEAALGFVADADRSLVSALLKLDRFIDLVIPALSLPLPGLIIGAIGLWVVRRASRAPPTNPAPVA